MLSEEGAREQSIYENSGEPIPRPRTDGEEVKNPNTEEVPIVILSNWIFRSRRSHKPYPYDTADKEFKEAIMTAWKNPENKSYKMICKEVAGKTREILDHTVQKQSYYCMIVQKDEHVENGYFSGDEESLVKLSEIRALAAGWYFEWELNNEYLLIIKSTSQEDKILRAETDTVVARMEEHMYSDSLDFEKYWKEGGIPESDGEEEKKEEEDN